MESFREMLNKLKEKLTGTEKALEQEILQSTAKDAENRRLQEEKSQLEAHRQQESAVYNETISKHKKDADHLIQLQHQQHNQDISTLKQQAQGEIQTKQQEISRLEDKNRNLQQENTGLRSEISGLQNDLRTAQALVQKYEQEQKSFLLYKNLSPSLKTSLKNVFHQETFENFVACCAQKDTIESLWLFTKTQIFNGEMESVDALEEIFRFSVACHNGTSESPVIHLIEGATGTSFDNEIHLGTPDSSRAGQIEKSLFAGYAVGRDKKVKQKAIVVVV